MMQRWLMLAASSLVLASVVVVFVAPAFDLEPTAMRAARMAQLALGAIGASASVAIGTLASPQAVAHSIAFPAMRLCTSDLLAADCTRQC